MPRDCTMVSRTRASWLRRVDLHLREAQQALVADGRALRELAALAAAQTSSVNASTRWPCVMSSCSSATSNAAPAATGDLVARPAHRSTDTRAAGGPRRRGAAERALERRAHAREARHVGVGDAPARVRRHVQQQQRRCARPS